MTSRGAIPTTSLTYFSYSYASDESLVVPHTNAAALSITKITVNGTGVTLEWPAGFGTVQVEQSQDLVTWDEVGEETGETSLTVLVSGPKAFYRLRRL